MVLGVSDFREDFFQLPEHTALSGKLGAKDFHNLTISQLPIFCFYLAFFAKNERILTIGVAVRAETTVTDRVSADESVWIWLLQILKAGQA